MFKSLITDLKASWKENESARQLAGLTDRQLEDVGVERFDAKILVKARRYRSREHVAFSQSTGVFAHPTA
ncbi:DUF1127 domain-containing protein [Methylobacterium sp. BTF04]|uniref:DUF1127 domain-containing protein n=1 Tax=Methylobacterium sp. BTF04 TaxID=2708300 RepID=UPI0013D1B7B4|nr:DUF1127 domain-containing protein [Methylobacterium sp. BTF04]NEU13893.1 DUF1127 domain-containing protein [Methylobacterium sp. BTF04]